MAQRVKSPCEVGFDGRAWLTSQELEAYTRRSPVRYLTRVKKLAIQLRGLSCQSCGETVSNSKDLQISHRVPFKIGIIEFGLTPDWLDSLNNLVLTHKGSCNDFAEIRRDNIADHLEFCGLDLNDSPVGGLTNNPHSGRIST